MLLAALALSGAPALAGKGDSTPPTSPPPNLFPSWLSPTYSPRYEPLTWQVPWISTGWETASGPWTLKSPAHGSFVSCDGANTVFGASPQRLTSSLNGRFGSTNLVEAPCAAAGGTFCSAPWPSTYPPELIATAQANAYVSLSAFWDYFASLGWQGLDGTGSPVNVEFGEITVYLGHGWNAATESTHYCPHSVLHLDHHVHELVHGIVAATADFSYNGTGSGGTIARVFNEAYADFFAEMVEFDAALPDTSTIPGSPGDYVVVTGKNNLGVSGSFDAPSRPCHLDPMVPGQAGYYENGGPIRHAMYLLAEGTDPPPPLPHSNVCQGPAVLGGIGRQATAEIFLDALVNCDWRKDGPTMDFCDIRRCTIEAASCPERNDVIRVWNAVELTAGVCGVWDKLCPIKDDPPASTR